MAQTNTAVQFTPVEGFHAYLVPGNYFQGILEITLDTGGAYVAGGYSTPTVAQIAAAFGTGVQIANIECEGFARIGAAGGTALGVAYDRVNNKLQLYGSNGAAQAPFIEFVGTPSAGTVVRLFVTFR